MIRTQQDAVIFIGVQRAYDPTTDVAVRFQKSTNLLFSSTSEDWIGLFRVGWTSVKERIAHVLAPQPTPGQAEARVTFSAFQVPTEDGRFYQFCYVTKDGAVRGASAPFQFVQWRREAGPERRGKASGKAAETAGFPVDHTECEALVREKNKVVEDIRATLSSLEEEVKGKASLLYEAESRLRACLEANAQLQGDLQAEAERNECLQSSVLEAERRCQEEGNCLRGELERSRGEISGLLEEKGRMEGVVSSLQEQLGALREEGKSRDAELKSQRALLQEARERARTLEQLDVEKEETLGVARGALETELAKVRALEQRLDGLEGDLARTREEKAGLEEAAQRQASELAALREAGREHVRALEGRPMEEEEEVEKPDHQEGAATASDDDEDDDDGDDDDVHGRALPECSGNSVERSAYEALLTAYEGLELLYRRAREELERGGEKAASVEARARDLESQCDELKARVAVCRREYEAKAKECLELRRCGGLAALRVTEVGEYQAKITGLEQRVKSLVESNELLSKELRESEKEQGSRIRELEEQLGRYEQRCQELKEQVEGRRMPGGRGDSASWNAPPFGGEESLRVCPICSIEFSLGAPVADFEQHVNSHLDN